MRTFASPSDSRSATAMRRELALTALPAGALLIAAVVLSANDGGLGVTTWYPVSLVVLALGVVVVAATAPRAAELWHGVRAPLAVFAGFVAWCYLSILWAQVPGDAWDGANRNLLYLIVFALVTLRPWADRVRRLAVWGAIAAVAGIGLTELVLIAVRSDASSLFLNGRLSSPTGYANSAAALLLMGALPAAWLAAERALAPPLRGLLVGTATMLVELALLSQSRGSVLALGVASLVALVLARRRWPTLVAIAVPLLATALAWQPLTAVHDATLAASAGRLDDAVRAIVISAVAAGLAGTLLAMLDGRVSPRLGAEATRNGNRALAGLAVLAAVVAVVAMGNPASWVDDRWVDFKTSGEITGHQNRFTGSLGSQRYDFYRVGLNAFADHPVAGIGADNFGPVYLREGRSYETPHYAHSLVVSTLAETGLIGAALLLGFLVLALRAGVRRVRDSRETAALAGLLGFTVLLAGSLVDWLWQFTGLGVLGMVMLGLAAARRAPGPADAVAEDPPRVPASGRVVAVGATFAAAVSLALPGLAARFVGSAYDLSATSPQSAVDRLDRAAALNPLSADALLAKGILERRLGHAAEAESAFDEALGRDADNWFAHFERGILASNHGRWAAAEADLRRARELNPRQPVVGSTLRAIAARRPVDADKAEQALAAQLESRLRSWAESPSDD